MVTTHPGPSQNPVEGGHHANPVGFTPMKTARYLLPEILRMNVRDLASTAPVLAAIWHQRRCLFQKAPLEKASRISGLVLAVSAMLGLNPAQAAEPVISNPLTTFIGTITGADPGEGLDLSGEFLYAISPGADPALNLKIGDATFRGVSPLNEVPGVQLVAGNQIRNFYGINFGDSPADNALETATSSIRWSQAGSATPAVTVTLDNLLPGNQYKFQMLFGEACCNRGFDLFVDDNLIVKDFNPGVAHPGPRRWIHWASPVDPARIPGRAHR